MKNTISFLKKGDLVEAKTVCGLVVKGSILHFKERTVVISVGVNCYLVRKSELEKNYVCP